MLRLLTMLLPESIYIEPGPCGNFRNIFPSNIGEDQTSLTFWARGLLHCAT